MSIKNIKEDLSNRLYLAKFRIKHKDTHLINKLKLSSTLLFIVILIPCVSLALSYSSKQFSVKSEEKIIEQNSYMSIASSGKFRSPISGTITSNYGYRKDPISGKYSKHTGIDISGVHHDNVKCITNGVVTFSGSQNGYGNCIEVKHNIKGKEIYSFYAHLSKILVKNGDQIKEGQIIAKEGQRP